mgnify:CR=1 FL=1
MSKAQTFLKSGAVTDCEMKQQFDILKLSLSQWLSELLPELLKDLMVLTWFFWTLPSLVYRFLREARAAAPHVMTPFAWLLVFLYCRTRSRFPFIARDLLHRIALQLTKSMLPVILNKNSDKDRFQSCLSLYWMDVFGIVVDVPM